jgi:hypothetical protein
MLAESSAGQAPRSATLAPEPGGSAPVRLSARRFDLDDDEHWTLMAFEHGEEDQDDTPEHHKPR